MKTKELESKVETIINNVEQKQLVAWQNEYNKNYFDPRDEHILSGEELIFNNPKLVVAIMDQWVAEQDQKITRLRKESDDPFFLGVAFGQRGVTLEEFKYVMSGKRPGNYLNSPAFYYFHIINEESHDYFVATNNDSEKDITTIYLERVQRFVQLEIPVLKAFFFTYFKKFFSLTALKRHFYILGGTGSGKSEVIKYLFYNLWHKSQERKNFSLISLEPHGKLSYELLQFNLLANDPERVVYLDPFLRKTAMRLCGEDILKENYTFKFNPFDLPKRTPNDINYATQELSYALFEILESETASKQMKGTVRACVSTLLANEGMSIDDLMRFMNDEENHDLVQLGLKNPNRVHRDYFRRFADSNLNQTKSGIFYRLMTLLDDIHLHRIFTGSSTVNIEQMMNEGKIVICNLAKGAMGKESAPMLGKLLVALIQGYATKREGSKHIKPTFLFMDEVQNYLTPSVESIMVESRKYGLHMILANQILRQLGSLQPIILGNTAVKLCGDVDLESAEKMAKTMGMKFREFDTLKKFHFFGYNKLNKSAGVAMMKVPANLVEVQDPYYVSKSTLRDYFLWLAHDSGYYVKMSPEAQIDTKEQGPGSNKPGGKVYPNTFND